MTFSTSTVKSRYTTGSTVLRPGKWGADPGSRPQGPVFWNAFLTIFQFCAWDWLGLKVLSGRGTLSLGQSPPVPTSPLVSTLGLPMCTWNWSEPQGALRFILPGFLVPCGWVLHPGGWPGAWIASLACALFLLQDCTRRAARMVLVYWFWMLTQIIRRISSGLWATDSSLPNFDLSCTCGPLHWSWLAIFQLWCCLWSIWGILYSVRAPRAGAPSSPWVPRPSSRVIIPISFWGFPAHCSTMPTGFSGWCPLLSLSMWWHRALPDQS